jgi:primosomal protein N' (replication factor Y)
MRPLLGRPSKQAAILNALVKEDDPLPPVSRILTVADASAATLSTMARKGWIDIEPKRSLILALPAAGGTRPDRAPRQRAVLEYLNKQHAPVHEQVLRQATRASSSVLRTMEEKGLIERIAEPATVILRLGAQEAMHKIGELRRAERQHRVLDYLLSHPPEDWLWVSWVYAETGCSLKDLRALERHGLVELSEREVWRDPLAERSFVLETPPTLTPAQERAWAAIRAQMAAPDLSPPVFLLHGVTGSGKTEIYIRAAQDALERGRQAIILVPEISLTTQTIRRFAARFSEGLGVIHSRLSDGERYDTWRRIRDGQIRLVIGPRSALFAPLEDIGLIVLDEEHDPSYKQGDRMPAYHARDVALHLAADQQASVLLGSATPDLVTYYLASERHSIQLLELPQRILAHRRYLEDQQARYPLTQIRYAIVEEQLQDVYAIDLPPVHVLDMRHELRAGNTSMFSRRLQQEMVRSLNDGDQAILFLNRRGASTFVMCRDCGTVIRCPHCDIPLTYHLKDGHLHCHHCNHRQAAPTTCPICASARIKHFGTGTQRVEQALHDLLPTARVLRWDRDTTTEKNSHVTLLDRFSRHEADVLIGTQMVAKGLDLPRVTLVGVISADTALNLPDFRAAERTFQLLTQVAGRAGRGPSGGQVIIQTYAPEHYAIQSAARHDYAGFYAQERAFRQQTGYPPFSRLARLVRSAPSLTRCRHEAQALGLQLRQRIQRHHLETLSLIGPAPCFLSRLRGNWRWQIIIRATSPSTELQKLLSCLTLAPGWQLDVDPLDML